MRTTRFGRRAPVAAVLALGAGLVASSGWGESEEVGTVSGHARALSLVIEQRFREPGDVTEDAESRVGAHPGMMRAWRVRAVEGQKDRFDVTFYIGDRPACVWRVDLRTSRVIPDDCSLEVWEERQA